MSSGSSLQGCAIPTWAPAADFPFTYPLTRPQPLRVPAHTPRALDRWNAERPHRSQPRAAHAGPGGPVASLIYLAPLISVYLHRIIVVKVILILINANHSNVSKRKMMSCGSRCKCSVICRIKLIPHLKKNKTQKKPQTPLVLHCYHRGHSKAAEMQFPLYSQLYHPPLPG